MASRVSHRGVLASSVTSLSRYILHLLSSISVMHPHITPGVPFLFVGNPMIVFMGYDSLGVLGPVSALRIYGSFSVSLAGAIFVRPFVWVDVCATESIHRFLPSWGSDSPSIVCSGSGYLHPLSYQFQSNTGSSRVFRCSVTSVRSLFDFSENGSVSSLGNGTLCLSLYLVTYISFARSGARRSSVVRLPSMFNS